MNRRSGDSNGASRDTGYYRPSAAIAGHWFEKGFRVHLIRSTVQVTAGAEGIVQRVLGWSIEVLFDDGRVIKVSRHLLRVVRAAPDSVA